MVPPHAKKSPGFGGKGGPNRKPMGTQKNPNAFKKGKPRFKPPQFISEKKERENAFKLKTIHEYKKILRKEAKAQMATQGSKIGEQENQQDEVSHEEDSTQSNDNENKQQRKKKPKVNRFTAQKLAYQAEMERRRGMKKGWKV
eukprot:Colp12_sorted_trinity150504_noHs@33821